MIPSLSQILLLLVLGCSFIHFLLAGARTFVPGADDRGAGWAQFSFSSGILATGYLGVYVQIHLYNGIAAAILLLCSLALYEWARHVIWGRGFHVGWSGDVPDSLCEEGPYAAIRHPVYLSYILAFLSALVALPTITMLVVFVLNAALYTHAAYSDERSLAGSAIAPEYAQYKQRAGMFFPRFTRRASAMR